MEQSRNKKSCNRKLPKELVMEILTRLPVKSLLRFMSVRKDWKSLISSDYFRKLHGKMHSSSLPLILTFHDSSYGFDEDLSVMKDCYLAAFDLYGNFIQKHSLPISSRCLILLSIPFQSKLLCFVDDHLERILFAYNPSTRRMFNLPEPPCFSLPKFRLGTLTFGYIPTKDEYMLMIVAGKNSAGTWVLEVLTFSISNDNNFQLHFNEWRSIEVSTTLNIFSIFSGLFVSQVFYWGLLDENHNFSLLSFDVETEVFSNFMYPEGGPRPPLIGLRDELYAMGYEDDPTLNLWKLCTDGNGNKSWTLYKTFSLQTLGYTKGCLDRTEFNWKIFVYRFEYLQCCNEPSNVSLEMGRLILEDDEYYMPDWDVNISTNFFAL